MAKCGCHLLADVIDNLEMADIYLLAKKQYKLCLEINQIEQRLVKILRR